MKKLLLALMATLMIAPSFAKGQPNEGVNWFNGTLNEALASAKKSKKDMVFIDCYASWCPPCKYMASKVFTTKAAGEYFNANFVNFKIDMEKGEGPTVAKKYTIKNYPTFLIVDTSGKELGRLVGGADTQEFIKLIDGLVKKAKATK